MFDNQFDNHNIHHQDSTPISGNSSLWDLDSLQKDDFELLSAFLDGEVTAAERQQVQQRLTTDAEMQRLHKRLLKLRQGFMGIENLPLPVVSSSAADLTQQVFARVDQRRQLRWGLGIGGAIAALAVGALSFVLSPNPTPSSLQLVQQPSAESSQPKPELLMIAVNRPVIEIPLSLNDPTPSPLQTN
jgi:anti-sigma factor RsiW